MKKYIILLLVLSSCTNNPFIGYIVCKEYVPTHMSNEKPTRYVEASYMPHCIIIINNPAPHKINETYFLFVANKDDVKGILVSKKVFDHYKIGTKIKVYNDTIYTL